MKKLIVILVIVCVLLIGMVGVLAMTSFDSYKAQEKVEYTEVFDSPTSTIYYYYSPICAHCHDIKPQVDTFVKKINETEGIDFKLVDMSEERNAPAYADKDYAGNINQMNLAHEVKVQGTPGAAYVKDGAVYDYGIGSAVFDVFETVADEFSIDIKFNRDAI